MKTFEALVIGGGPGGYVAAIALAKAGVSTCLIEGHKLGGTCLNYGCIPTKSFYHYAKTLHHIKEQNNNGLVFSDLHVDFEKIKENKNQTVSTLVSGVETLMNKNKITVLNGYGSFVNDHEVEIAYSDGSKERVHGNYIIIASGSETIVPKIEGIFEGLKEGYVVTSKELLEIEEIPKTIAIIGGGVIGMEFATIFNQFGSSVTVIEGMDTILPNFHSDLVKRYKPLLKKQNIQVITGSLVTKIEKKDTIKLYYENKKNNDCVEADLVLCAVGRKPAFSNLSLEKLSRTVINGNKLEVNEVMQSKINHIYVVGDVNGLSLLAHSASKQGLIAADEIINQCDATKNNSDVVMGSKGFNTYAIPQVAFLIPELSQVQSTRYEDLVSEKDQVKKGKFNYRSNGMSLAQLEKDGICLVEYNEKDESLIYMGILGESSAELIQHGVHFMDQKSNIKEMTESIIGHPSLSEILHEALLDLDGKSIHQI